MSKESFQQQKAALGPLAGSNSQMLSGATAVSSALLYGGTAVAMNFVNKLTLQTFPMPNVILLLQMLAMLGILLVCNMLGLTSVSLASWEKARSMILITSLYTANTSTALMGLTTLSIPMYSTLKRLTPMIVIVVKSAINRRLPEWSIATSVGLVVMGCVVASVGDLKFDSYGYLMALLSCSLQASYLLLVEASGAEKGHGTAELLYYNALLSVPFMLLVVVLSGEAEKLAGASSLAAASMGGALQWGLLLLVCSCCGCLLNYSLFLCTIHNNALTTTVIGVLKGVVATMLGFVLLGGVEFHSVNVAGICCNTLGGIWYTSIRYRQRVRAKQASVPASASLAAGKGSSVIQLQAKAGGSLV